VQSRVGVRERSERAGQRMIRDSMPDEHRELFEKLPYLVVGGGDEHGRLWASLLTGEPGFVKTPEPSVLSVRALPAPGDPLRSALGRGRKVGLLGIELSTRRRNRVNGTIVVEGAQGFSVSVEQSFGNCPQYITVRAVIGPRAPATVPEYRSESARLSVGALELIERSDTFFIATASRRAGLGQARPDETEEGIDVSHRGGPRGFVRASDDGPTTRLTWPDYRGNFMFNTLGNLEVNPRAGLLFVDFERGAVCSLTGTAEVVWDGPEVRAFQRAERLVRFQVESGVLGYGVVPFVTSGGRATRSDRKGVG
jgi:hypothetical protein